MVSFALACHDSGGTATLSGGGSGSASASASATAEGGGSSGAGSSGASSASASAASDTAAGSSSSSDATATATDDAGSSSSASGADGSGSGGSGGESSSSGGELQDGVLDVTFIAHDDCTFTLQPASISVPEGTEFTVNWISSARSAVPADIAKIDRFNAVPIILGMEPGTSYHDEVRVWCGALFTGTFDFELTSCYDPVYLPVDCSA
ncbi:MAG: hypothetical protein K1X88_18730 [Nannocystaceae bacterium]|nr:hypothetical protein [Nannocystaceae bacterium]